MIVLEYCFLIFLISCQFSLVLLDDNLETDLSFFLFRRGRSLDQVVLGNSNLTELLNDVTMSNYDVFGEEMSAYRQVTSTYALLQNQTTTQKLVQVLLNYTKGDLNNTLIFSYDNPNNINYTSSILLEMNPNFATTYAQKFDINYLLAGGYTSTTKNATNVIQFGVDDYLNYIGLKFDSSKCPKYFWFIESFGNNPNFKEKLAKEFGDVISVWNKTFIHLGMNILYKTNEKQILYNMTEDFDNITKLSQIVDQFLFDYELGRTINLTRFYINGSIEKIKLLDQFFLYELYTHSSIHNSILIEPFLYLFMNVSNMFLDNNCTKCELKKKSNNYLFQVDDVVFAALNKMLKFNYFINSTFLDSYKYLPSIDNGYYLSFELCHNSTMDYFIRVKDISGKMNKLYQLNDFNNLLNEYVFYPPLTYQEKTQYCDTKTASSNVLI